MANLYIESEKLWCAPSQKIRSPNQCLGQVILSRLKAIDPNRILEVEHESGASLTAEEILSQTITVAQNLMQLGVKKGDVVIVFSKSSIKITPITFALYTIGAPINFFYLDLKPDDIKYYFKQLDPTVILYEEEFKFEVDLALKKLKLAKLKHVFNLNSESDLFESSFDTFDNFEAPNLGDPNKLIAVLPFTSGSTGRPKIVMQSHSMIIQSIFNKWWQIDSNSVVCVLSDLRWMDQVGMMLQQVFFNVKRIYTSKCEKDFDETYEFDLLHRNKVTNFFTIPILILRTLRNAVKSNTISKLSHLRTILIGGEAVTGSLVKYLKEVMPDCKVISSYGMTELDVKIASDEEVIDKVVNGGVLADGYIAKILDERENPLGPNEKGRLYLKPQVPALGYFKNDKANREYFKEDGWFRTEEYAFMDSDHLLNVVIRFKYLLRFKGQFIDPTAIENIINAHPMIRISALVGHSSAICSDSDEGTLFMIIEREVNRDNMENHLKTMLRSYLEINQQNGLVRYFEFIDKMPLLNYCKIDRITLSERAAREFESYSKV